MHLETTNVCFRKEKDYFLKIISIFVIVLHGIFLCVTYVSNQNDLVKVKKSPQKLVVQTIHLKPVQIPPVINISIQEEIVEIAEAMEVASVAEVFEIEPVKEEMPIKVEPVKEVIPIKLEPAKKAEFKKVTPKKPEPVKKVEIVKKVDPVKKTEPIKKVESVKKIEPIKTTQPINKVEPKKPVDKGFEESSAKKAKQKELLSLAQQNLAKIDKITVSKANSQKTILPEKIGSLSVDAVVSAESSSTLNVREIGYRDELGARLKSLLKLPEHGQVNIKLTLDRLGKVMKLDVVNSGSDKNKKYIESTIKTLTFPSFQGAFKDFPEYTFSITLK